MKYWERALFLFLVILAAPAFADSTVNYSYDALGRLVRSVSSGTSTANTGYTLDPAGNRINMTVGGPAFSINSVTVGEGAGTATLTVTKSGTASGTLSVNFATANGTALAGSDYTATSGTLTFAAADTTKTINVTITDDAAVDPDETFTVNLSGASSGSTIGQGTGTVTITDNEAPPGPSFAISAASPVSEGGLLVYTVTKSGSGAANVNYASANGTATAGSDYTATSGTLSFASGDTTKTISVPTTDDSNVEPDETVLMNLSGATGGATITTAQGSGMISNNDASFAISAAPPVAEGVSLVYTVTKTGNIAANVNYASADGTATAGSDYTATSGTLNFAADDATQTISVPTTDDSNVEPDETLLMNLSGATGGATITTAQGSGTINDNDSSGPSFSIDDPSITEAGHLTFTVSLAAPATTNLGVSYATANGTAVSGMGGDYSSRSGSLSFKAGDISETIDVPTSSDAVAEGDEYMYVNLSSPTGGATIADSQGMGTIIDDDGPANCTGVSFTIASTGAVTEGTNSSFTVTKTGSTSSTCTVDYATGNGTAIAGSDYTAKSNTLSFTSTQTSRTVNVVTSDDASYEPAETFSMTLSNPSAGATLGSPSTATATINDNDIGIFISDASALEGSQLTFTVTLSQASATQIGVSYATVDGTAVAGSPGDYSSRSGNLTFKPGDTSQTFTVPSSQDTLSEGNESFLVNLASPTGPATLADAQGVGTIVDDDLGECTGISFTITSNGAVTEGTNSSFTVTKAGSTPSTCTVDFATANGTAIAGSDYTAKSTTLSFTSTQTSRTVNVVTTDDAAYEPAETFSAALSNPSGGATLGSPSSATATINDNDIGIFISDASATEGAQLTFTVTLSQVPSSTVSVAYATADGTAISGTPRDYSSRSGTLNFSSGQTSKTISVPSNQDTLVEGNESFYVNLSAPSAGTTIADGQGVGTIVDND